MATSILPAGLLEKLRRLQNAIQMQEDILESLHHEQESLIREAYGIDLEKETWDLDLELGTLSKDGSNAD